MDIIILLICTFLIINKLIKMLGQFDPESDRERKQRYSSSAISSLFKQKYGNKNDNMQEINIINAQTISAEELKLSEEIKSVLNQIRSQDIDFDFDKFMNGVRKAYIMAIKAIAEADLATLEFLMESDVYIRLQQDIEKSKLSALINKNSVQDIEQMTLVDAALYGDRAVLTVDIHSQQIAYTEDSNGNLISGSPDQSIAKSHKIMFSRYLTQSTVWKISKMS
jgi:predicted lipid-binding transport protein (Tim44 family)